MIVTPTLHFYGQCEEALRLYQKAFDLKIHSLLHYSGADPRDWNVSLTPEQQAYVYHSEASIGGQRIRLADEIGRDASQSTSLFLTITFETADQVKQAYAALTAEGSLLHPLRSTTYSSCRASVVDKFGFRWGLMTEQTDR